MEKRTGESMPRRDHHHSDPSVRDTASQDRSSQQQTSGLFKKRQRPSSRKRPSKSSEEEEEDEAMISASQTAQKSARKMAPSTTILSASSSTAISKKRSIDEAASLFVPFKASGTAASLSSDMATRTLDVDGVVQDPAHPVESTTLSDDPNVYTGLSAYKEFVNKKIHNPTQSTAGGLRAGPLKGQTNVRISIRMDYAPDVCKDYKETGFCGFGDSCKFLHDRGDYKAGWQIDREWEQQRKKAEIEAQLAEGEDAISTEAKQDKSSQFTCPICNNLLINPVKTKCNHIFCEKCALKQFAKSQKCSKCGALTAGVFIPLPKEFKDELKAFAAESK